MVQKKPVFIYTSSYLNHFLPCELLLFSAVNFIGTTTKYFNMHLMSLHLFWFQED